MGGPAHPDELLAAYAVDALDEAERAAVADHLAGCAHCRAELGSFHEALAQLPVLVGEPPPAELWDRITAELDAPAEPPAHGQQRHADADAEELLHRGELVAPSPLDARRRPRWHGLLAGSVAAAAAALLAVVVTAGILDRGDARPDVVELADAALQAPGTRVVPLATPEGAQVARVVVGGQGRGSFVVLDGLAPLGPDGAYQLWALDGEVPVSLGVLGDGTELVVALPVPAEAQRLAISAEGRGGAAAPTLPPVAVA